MSFVYRYLGADDEILYIGKVNGRLLENLKTRLDAHRTGDPWAPAHPDARIEYAAFDSPADADAVETLLIAKYHPRYNKSKTGWGGCSFIDLLDHIEWKPYPYGCYYETALRQRTAYIHSDQCDFCKSAIYRNTDAYSHIEVKCPNLDLYYGFYLCEDCAEKVKELVDDIDEWFFPLRYGKTKQEFDREFKNAEVIL